MSLQKLGCWAVLLAAGCDGRLRVDQGNAAAAGVAGSTASAGLSCNSKGTCVAAPDCQHDDALCILRRVESADRIPNVSRDAHTGIVALAVSFRGPRRASCAAR